MSELALDHSERDAFAGHLDGVSVAELMGRETAADAGGGAEAAEFIAGTALRLGAAAGASFDDTEERSDRQLEAVAGPGLEVLPAPVVHPDPAALAAVPVTNQNRGAARLEV